MEAQHEIVAGLEQRFGDVMSWFTDREVHQFESGPDGHWTEGQQLDHLLRSTKPLNLALRLPRVALRLKFGTTSRACDGYDDLVARYDRLLAEGGKASGQFVPPKVLATEKATLLERFRQEGTRLVAIAGKWSEPDLDTYQLPHPLLGNLSIREMLQFAYHHMGHHLETLRRDYG